jgi:hypothetical protein
MEEMRFTPVIIQIAPQQDASLVCSVQQAWKMLAEDWPTTETKYRNKALTICRLALVGKASAEVARAAFVEAAKRGGLVARKA